jgi:hypothetical protein
MPSREVERRYVVVPVEYRASKNGGPGVLAGYAAKFGTDSEYMGFIETIAPGAFTKTLSESPRVMCRYNHEDSFLLGTTEASTLRLSVDDTGLLYEVDLPDTQAGRDVATLAARGDVRYSSFAFCTIKDEWMYDAETCAERRILREVQLVDVAPVNSPAYLDTSTALRALEMRKAERDAAEKAGTPTPELRGSDPETSMKDGQSVEPREHSTVPPSVLSLQMDLDALK